jgi:RNA polymerase sigma-70 factor (ECF subfamily)
MDQTDTHRRRYELWVRDFAQPLYRCAYRLTGIAQVAEDLVQETFMEAWRSIANQKGDDRARGWLFQILRYRYAHFIRDKSRRIGMAPGAENSEFDRPDVLRPPLEKLADKDALQAALNELSPAMRETFLMVFAEECSCRETAENLKIPLGTVLSRLDSARRTLRAAMDRAEANTQRKSEGRSGANASAPRDGGIL